MRKLRKLAERQYGVFSRTQAKVCQVTPAELKGMLRSGEIECVTWGVYRIVGSVPSWHQRLMIAVLAAGPGAAVAGKAAAALLGMPGYRQGPVEVVQTRRPSRRFHYGQEHSTTFLPERQVRVVAGIPVTSVERTIFDLCGRASEKRARWLVKIAVSKKFTTPSKLALVLTETGAFGRPGTRMLRLVLAALKDDDPPTESELEDLVLAVLAAAGLELPNRQVEVGGTTAPIGRIDFLYRGAGIVIEADSKRWHGNWVATEADHRRDALLTAAGFHVIRTNFQQLVEEPELFVNAIRGALARAA
jgi:very-short-patch-repair endonuclease